MWKRSGYAKYMRTVNDVGSLFKMPTMFSCRKKNNNCLVQREGRTLMCHWFKKNKPKKQTGTLVRLPDNLSGPDQGRWACCYWPAGPGSPWSSANRWESWWPPGSWEQSQTAGSRKMGWASRHDAWGGAWTCGDIEVIKKNSQVGRSNFKPFFKNNAEFLIGSYYTHFIWDCLYPARMLY